MIKNKSVKFGDGEWAGFQCVEEEWAFKGAIVELGYPSKRE